MGALAPDAGRRSSPRPAGIPIYTIGAGKDGIVPYPDFRRERQEDRLPHGSRPTSTRTPCAISPRRRAGSFFRAADTGTIESAFQVDRRQPEDRVPGKELPPDDGAVPLARRPGPRALRRRRAGSPAPDDLRLAPAPLAPRPARGRSSSGSSLRSAPALPGIAHPKILRAEAGLRQRQPHRGSPAAVARPPAPLLLCAGLALGIVALARPQWGRLDEPVFDQSRDIIIALDLSRSMLTPDVKPSRLERSKLLIQSLLDQPAAASASGSIVFSGTAFLQSPDQRRLRDPARIPARARARTSCPRAAPTTAS